MSSWLHRCCNIAITLPHVNERFTSDYASAADQLPAKLACESPKRIRLRKVPGHRNGLTTESACGLRFIALSTKSQIDDCRSQQLAQRKSQVGRHRVGIGVARCRRVKRRGVVGKPAARASASTFSRASATRSENVVSATSWRGVKRRRERSASRSCGVAQKLRGSSGNLRSGSQCRLGLLPRCSSCSSVGGR